jgi:hypothetical protein
VNPADAPAAALVTAWDRLAVIVLGGAGCALSASALMQMAIAIHIRPALCWLFPLVVDGFIAYGIRALLVLRTAPLRARLYVWTLVGTATGVSVWANALHAVRLNQTAAPGGGLQLGDTVVAYLSTVAPLALAGAVHLYILIARGADSRTDRADRADRVDRGDRPGQVGHPGAVSPGDRTAATAAGLPDQRSPHAGQRAAGQAVTAPTEPPRAPRDRPTEVTGVTGVTGALNGAGVTGPVTARHDAQPQRDQGADQGGQPDSGPLVTGRPVAARAAGHPPAGDRESRRTGDRRADPDTEDLLAIARSAVRAEDKLTRKVVAQAIRGQKIPLSSDTLTALMAQLREQRDEPVTARRD